MTSVLHSQRQFEFVNVFYYQIYCTSSDTAGCYKCINALVGLVHLNRFLAELVMWLLG